MVFIFNRQILSDKINVRNNFLLVNTKACLFLITKNVIYGINTVIQRLTIARAGRARNFNPSFKVSKISISEIFYLIFFSLNTLNAH